MDATTQYNPAHLYPYLRTAAATAFPGSSEDLNNNGITDGGEDTNANNTIGSASERDFSGQAGLYFRNPGITNEVRQKDQFWIIGAGPDRKFGTRDDQTNFGSLQ